MGNNCFLKIDNISKTYPGIKACDSICLEVKHGEVHALVGENGAGKSTFIKILAGVEQPDPGSEIIIDGKHIPHFINAIDSAKKGIAVIFQDFSLFPNLSVAENISFSVDLEEGKKLVNWKKINHRAKLALKEVGITDIEVDSVLESLSIAKQQLVAIARSLILNAKLIIMDEPTSSLTKGEVDNLFKIINDLKVKGISTLFISHKLDEVFKISDRVTVLRDGKLIGTYLKEDLNEQKLISLMVGRDIEFIKKSSNIVGDILLDIRSITKKGNFKDISFKLHKNEILSITGLVGSGRTEVAKAIFGLNIPDSGEIYLRGEKRRISSPEAAMKYGISYVPENRQHEGLIMGQSIRKNMSISVLNQLKNKLGFLNFKKEKAITNEMIEKLDVRAYSMNMLVRNLSGGNQQKVVLGKWIATKPEILIIDEPTNGIDVGAKSEIHKLLQSFADAGMGILMISSELPEVFAVSDRIIVMRRGRVAAEFDIKEATQEKIMSKAISSE